jgi:ribonucleoside-diphosphate reductase beta chain
LSSTYLHHSTVIGFGRETFPWMSETMDLKKEKNFFETRVIEYQNGGAIGWE